ncbi:MAG: hypothetical protein U1E13_03105 [Methylophilaceae bacterium]|uniref:hypothetical protein n=2 Tax=Methylicorpusculum sp. TaxID=2713644 RepID=UPI0027275A9D|nr:hypothetical protein [Methylicorpusculum sp.]MDO8845909.1 hypothetical protein [Methylicorpusculum sp.]MDP2179449.1 hypothetical protein [Methylicorpusculum sp.]MDP3531454.1 hypothetical protein [Methylicorpusculum sp.]MDZ4097671.1 hypothetical protein [Methylophilaceae bacterium]
MKMISILHFKTRTLFRPTIPLVVKPGSRHIGVANEDGKAAADAQNELDVSFGF